MFTVPSSCRAGSLMLLAVLAACASDPVRPNDSIPTRVVLDVAARDLGSLGDTSLIRPVVYDQHGVPMAGVQVDWSLSTDGVVVPVGHGAFRAVGNGDVTVRAAVLIGATGVRPGGYWTEPIAASANLRVQQRPARLTIAPVDTMFTTVSSSRRLLVGVSDARGNTMQMLPEPIRYQSTNSDVVIVDETGVVRSRKLGVARVSASLAGLSTNVTFAVDPRLAHTACMVYAKRRRASQQCVTNGFTVHAPAGEP